MDFYTLVIIISIVLLIISLALFFTVVIESTSTASFPPYQNKCPDYWSWNDATSKCSSVAGKNTGIGGSTTTYTPSSEVCSNMTWAKTNGIQWDGVSNTNQCVCNGNTCTKAS
jgi:hypothetical protein